ncbi:hypothetical protein I7I48_09880 [Histoplasma ohiense]|nr:hypothetical protein I7I48_09880 [Histoplasma ohiense (nom. inval.)]
MREPPKTAAGQIYCSPSKIFLHIAGVRPARSRFRTINHNWRHLLSHFGFFGGRNCRDLSLLRGLGYNN